MNDALPARLSDEGRVATWNPALTRAQAVILEVSGPNGQEERRTVNSGRARVRDPERIVAVRPARDA